MTRVHFLRPSAPVLPALLLLLAGALGWSPGLSAQITGRVLDQGGNPIEGAAVEAWGDDRRLATRLTDATGTFTIPAVVAVRTTALYAARIGFRARRVDVEPGAGPVEIRLDSEAIALPSVEVVTPREFCPRPDEREAREIWQAVRQRYAHGLDTMGVATYLATNRGLVDRDELGIAMPVGAAEEQRGSSFLLRVSWDRRIDREGYAYPVRRPTAGGALDSWVYAPLEADLAPHFIGELFGRLHTLSVFSEDETGWRLAFCPRDRDRASIQGTLHVTPDTTLVAAEWLFRTPEPGENAGGRAVFIPGGRRGSNPYLLPSEGMSWRMSPEGGFQQVQERYEGWIVAPGDSVPFLPSRKATNPVMQVVPRMVPADAGPGAPATREPADAPSPEDPARPAAAEDPPAVTSARGSQPRS